MAGRPCKWTPELQDKLCGLLSEGNTRQVAAVCAGISVPTFGVWMRSKEEPFLAFQVAVKEAEAKAVAHAVSGIKKAGERQWQALAWYLERRYPETWGSNNREIRELQRRLDELERKGVKPETGDAK